MKVRNWGNRKNNLHVKGPILFWNSAKHCVSGVQFLRALLFNFREERIGQDTKLLPLRETAENFGLVRKSMRPKLGRRSFFTPEGKVALMFLKMYTGLSCPKLLERLNGNIHYQIFCDVIIDPTRPMTNYKLLDDVMMELAGKLKIQISRAYSPTSGDRTWRIWTRCTQMRRAMRARGVIRQTRSCCGKGSRRAMRRCASWAAD